MSTAESTLIVGQIVSFVAVFDRTFFRTLFDLIPHDESSIIKESNSIWPEKSALMDVTFRPTVSDLLSKLPAYVKFVLEKLKDNVSSLALNSLETLVESSTSLGEKLTSIRKLYLEVTSSDNNTKILSDVFGLIAGFSSALQNRKEELKKLEAEKGEKKTNYYTTSDTTEAVNYSTSYTSNVGESPEYDSDSDDNNNNNNNNTDDDSGKQDSFEQSSDDEKGNQDSGISPRSNEGRNDSIDESGEAPPKNSSQEKSAEEEFKNLKLIDNDDFWTRRFWELIDTKSVPLKWKQLIENFTYESGLVCRIIVNELHIQNDQKFIKTFAAGGAAGGEKYKARGVFVKFPEDKEVGTTFIYGRTKPDSILAGKACNHDIKGWSALFSAAQETKNKFKFPLLLVVDYAGFRLEISSFVAVNKKSLCYGTADGGHTILFDEKVHEKMKSIAKFLKLKTHKISNSDVELAVCADIEVHKVENENVILDWARLFPPQFPISGIPTNIFTHMYRPELLQEKAIPPLSSDALSGFGAEAENNDDVKKACIHLLQLITKFAKILALDTSLNSKYITGVEFHLSEPLVSDLHARGINLRHLGKIWNIMQIPEGNDALSSFILLLLVVRTLKNKWRRMIQEQFRANDKISVLQLAREYSKEVINKITQQDKEFQDEILQSTIVTYGIQKSLIDQLLGNSMENLWAIIDPTLTIIKFTNLCGIKLSQSFKHKLQLAPQILLSDTDVEDFLPIIKYPSVLDFELGEFWLAKLEDKSLNEKHQIQYLSKAVSHFLVCVANNATTYRKKYSESMLALFKINPYSSLCKADVLADSLQGKITYLNIFDEGVFAEIKTNVAQQNILDFILTLSVQTSDSQLKKTLEIALLQHTDLKSDYGIQLLSPQFLTKFFEHFQSDVEEFAMRILKKFNTNNRRQIYQQLLLRFPHRNSVTLCMVLAALSNTAWEQNEYVSHALQISSSEKIEEFVKQLERDILSTDFDFSNEIWSLLKAITLIHPKSDSLVISLIVLSEDFRLACDEYKYKDYFGWKTFTETVKPHSLWFYILKLVKVSKNPLDSIRELLKTILSFKGPNTFFLSLFEICLYAIVTCSKCNKIENLEEISKEKLEVFANLYVKGTKKFLQSGTLQIFTNLDKWKTGFVEIWQYVLTYLPKFGWDIVYPLHSEFIKKCPDYGYALIEVLKNTAVLTSSPTIKQLCEKSDNLKGGLSKQFIEAFPIPICDVTVFGRSLRTKPLVDLAVQVCSDSCPIPQIKWENVIPTDVTIESFLSVALSCYSTKDTQPILKFFEHWVQKFTEIKTHTTNDFLEFLKDVISEIPSENVLETCFIRLSRHFTVIASSSPLFKTIACKYLAVVQHEKSQLLHYLKTKYNYSWLPYFQYPIKNVDLLVSHFAKLSDISKFEFTDLPACFQPTFYELSEKSSAGQQTAEKSTLLLHLSNNQMFNILLKKATWDKTSCLVLFMACKKSQIITYKIFIHLLVHKYQTPEERQDIVNVLFIGACLGEHWEICDMLREQFGANINSMVEVGTAAMPMQYSMLCWALFSDKLPAVTYLVQHGADVNVKDKNGYTALNYAEFQKKSAFIEVLSEAKVNSGEKKTMITEKKEPEKKPDEIITPDNSVPEELLKEALILFDIVENHPVLQEATEKLLAKFEVSHLEKMNRKSDTTSENKLLHQAAAKGNSFAASALLKMGVNPNIKNKANSCPLLTAVSHGSNDVIGILLSHGARCFTEALLDADPIFYTTAPATVSYLLEKGSNINARAFGGNSVLHRMAIGGKDMFNFLLSKGADVNAKTDTGETVLHSYAQRGDIELLGAALEKGISVNATNNNGETPLYSCTMSQNLKAITFLLEHGAEIDKPSKVGYTPLMFALMAKYKDVAAHLVECGADFNTILNNEPIYLDKAFMHEFKAIARTIVPKKPNSSANKSASIPPTPSSTTVTSKPVTSTATLSATKTATTPSAIKAATSSARPASSSPRSLPTPPPATKSATTSSATKPPVRPATTAPAPKPASTPPASTPAAPKPATPAPAAPKPASPAPASPTSAAPTPAPAKAKTAKNPDINKVDESGNTQLHNLYMPSRETIERLIEEGADLEIKNSSGFTPLFFGLLKSDINLVTVLIEHGADKETETPTNKHRPLHMAVMTGNIPMINLLAEKGADLNCRDNIGYTPLTHAVSQDKRDVISLLVAKGADTTCKDFIGRSLGDCCSNNPEIMKLLEKKS